MLKTITIIFFLQINFTLAQYYNTGGPFSEYLTCALNYNDSVLLVYKKDIGLYKTSDLGNSWRKINIPNFGFNNFTAMVKHIDGDIFAATTDSGLLRSTDLGENWISTPTTQFGKISCVFAKSNGYLFVGGENNGLFRSSDLGQNWTTMTLNFGRVQALAESSQETLFILANGILYISANNGYGWQHPHNAIQPPVYMVGDNFNSVYVAGNGFMKRSVDQGVSYNNLGYINYYDRFRSVSITSDSIIFIGKANGEYYYQYGSITRSNNYGTTFYNHGLTHTSVTHTLLFNNQYLIAANNEGIYKNEFRSSSQFIKIDNDLKEPPVLDFITTFATVVTVCDSGGIFKYSNNTGWQRQYANISSDARISTAYIRFFVLIGTRNMGLWRTTDNGATWSRISLNNNLNEDIFSIRAKDDNLIFCATKNNGVFVSTDKGINWRFCTNGLPEAYSIEALDVNNSGNCFLSTTNDGLFFSEDSGYTWVPRSQGLPLGCRVTSITHYNDILFCTTYSDGVFKSTNQGSDWYKLTSGLPANLSSPTIRVKSNGHVFIGNDRMVYGSFNLGENWFNYVPVPVGVKILSMGFDNAGYLYVGCDNGAVYKSYDNILPVELSSFTAQLSENKVLLTWSTETETNNLGFEIQRTSDSTNWITIGFKEGNGTTTEPQNYLYEDNISEFYNSVLQYRLKQIDYDGSYDYSEVAEVVINSLDYNLSQNYPNPFNPSTKISWQSPVSAHQTLKVYDVLGNEVATLVNEFRNAGSYEVDFDASKLSSGVYFYKLQAGDFVQTKKMLLMK